MAAYAAVVSLMNTIDPVMKHPRLSTSLDSRDIQSLLEKAGILLGFVESWNYYGDSKEVAALERQITSAAHKAEDVIESHIVVQIHAGTSEVTLRCLWDLHKIIEDMDAIIEKAAQVKGSHGFKEEKQPYSRLPSQRADSAMVGFDDELIQLTDELTRGQSNRRTISIVGMGGMGKTTLAKTVYENPLIMYHFDVHAWATVSQHYSVDEIFSQLLSSLGAKHNSREQLHKTLFGRRYLIILDDIWSVEVWDEVNQFFPDNGNGSCIVVTSRSSSVASYCGSSCFTKKFLNENEGWELFCKKAFGNEVCPPELEKVGKEIVKLCKGLPLSIVVIGGRLLKSPRDVEYWENVANDIRSIPNSEEKRESLDVLFSSYNHLPAHLKPCFLYMGVLQSVLYDIPVSKVINLWVAEGFLKSNGARVLEEIAEDYLKDLIDRNLILINSRSDRGKIKNYGIHDLLSDLCLKVVEQQEFVCMDKFRIRGLERRFIFANVNLGTGTPLARSIITRYIFVHSLKLKIYRLLRILDTESETQVKQLSRCFNLRYFSLLFPQSARENLSALLSVQWNIQTIVVTPYLGTTIDIWKMQQLRYVKCGGIYIPDPCVIDGEEDFTLENLHTLKVVVNLRLTEEVCKMVPNLKKLGLWCNIERQGYDNCMENLSNLSLLHKLESLKLQSYPFSDVKLNKIPTLPSSLNKLTLRIGHLHWDDLTLIGLLPKLEVLKLEFGIGGKRWSPINGQFLSLKVLTIYHCDLDCWIVDSCHFPVLEKLVLQDLETLEEIPLGIGEIDTLKLIIMEYCSRSALISAVKIQNKQLQEYDNNDLQIKVWMSSSDDAMFMEMVETEGLNIKNIQFF